MKTLKQLFLGVIAVTMLIACSKEKKISKQLEGTWTITEVVTIINGSSSTDNTETTTTFNKDGTGSASSSGSGTNPFPSEFTWSNTAEKLTIIDTKNPETFIFDILDHSKKEMKLNRKYTDAASGDTIDHTITMNK